MTLRWILITGHWPTVVASFLYLTVSFMAWVSLAPLIIYINIDPPVSTDWRLRLLATPILIGSLLRVPMGLLVDMIGGKTIAVFAQTFLILCIGYVVQFGLNDRYELITFSICLGVAGASFAIAIPQASHWYPARYQGLIMGVVGSGNVGAALVSLYAPTITEMYGWQAAYGYLLIVMIFILCFYILAARDAKSVGARPRLAGVARLFYVSASRFLVFLYFITFGGFIGLSSTLPLLFTTKYDLGAVLSGLISALVIMVGSVARPVGGYLADRYGGMRVLLFLLGLISINYLFAAFQLGPGEDADFALIYFPLSRNSAKYAAGIFLILASCLGMGNGAVFQLIGQHFRDDIGAMTGITGAAGGLGGFLLAYALAFSQEATGGFRYGFLALGFLALWGLVRVYLYKDFWEADAPAR
jgi:NNP family nitrate/nitrite transporter-like MFS transporter